MVGAPFLSSALGMAESNHSLSICWIKEWLNEQVAPIFPKPLELSEPFQIHRAVRPGEGLSNRGQLLFTKDDYAPETQVHSIRQSKNNGQCRDSLYFPSKETKAQMGYATCRRSHSLASGRAGIGILENVLGIAQPLPEFSLAQHSGLPPSLPHLGQRA